MKHRWAVIIAIVVATVLVAMTSMLSAASDSEVLHRDALAALDVLNKYFGNDVPTSPEPTATPVSTATPTPTFTVPLEGCRKRDSGDLGMYGIWHVG